MRPFSGLKATLPYVKGYEKFIEMQTSTLMERFLAEQQPIFEQVIGELMRGRKEGQWTSIIFPRIKLDKDSEDADLFGLTCLDEAIAYINHPLLRANLLEACHVLLMRKSRSVRDILGEAGALHLKACMTLFELADPDTSVFTEIINTFFQGERCKKTMSLL